MSAPEAGGPEPGGAEPGGSEPGRDATGAASRRDRLLGGRVVLSQPESGYRAAIDPVLLAAAVPAAPGERALDLGCGVGAATLCLAVRIPGLRVAGIELQPQLAALARLNAAQTGIADRVSIAEGDLRDLQAGAAGYDHVLANPPYLRAGTHTPPPDASRAAAHGEGEADLAAWIAAAARMLRPRGLLTLVHRADRFDEVVACLRPRFGSIALFPLWPRAGVPARRVLVQACKGARGPARVLPGLILHGPDGRYTAEAEAVLRDAAALTLAGQGGAGQRSAEQGAVATRPGSPISGT
ncbi:tRNA1(Val) (adenine(37)-N6)-methyltransferase [Arenibaculum pallidiluteum]|uniref:tRNA1(Val) (adenine(37)-N6)-methyltransferase n=1 Tax=Arenibaculum pallidiluteum TaxID=2812559 RepID=UPI001A976A4B|nr:methyltransferase [Arenibaculum pallidiluteum]